MAPRKQHIQPKPKRVGRRCAAISRSAIVALVVTGLMAGTASGQLPCSYTVTVLPNAPCFDFHSPAIPTAINNQGQVLLYGSQCFEAYNETYIWTGGPTLTLIPRPAGMLGFTGWDLNDNGLICGEAQYPSPSGPRAVVYNTNTGQWTILPPLNPPEGWSGAFGINNNNEVCGYRSIGGGREPHVPQTAFRWSASAGFTDLGVMNGPNSWATDIAEDGTIVGWTGGNPISTFTRAFVHTGGVTTILPAIPDGFNSYAVSALSSTRVAVEGRTIVNGNLQIRGYAYYNGAFIPLGVLPGFTRTIPVVVDAVGQVYGYCTAPNTGAAFVWRNGMLVTLTSLLVTPGTSLREVRDLSSNGVIVGSGNLLGETKALVLTPAFSRSGDTDCNSAVNVNDLLDVINHWGTCHGCSSDLNGDEVVGIPDLLEVLFNWD